MTVILSVLAKDLAGASGNRSIGRAISERKSLRRTGQMLQEYLQHDDIRRF
jgi:hypothetical protein